ncbi:hypothetical protein [Antarcticirhabdus aurantiaca]|uniref:Uncharacterized protein n=1 Tax=Antarcticirhabdus aurantiaca TaxID=2606717 RepID=A0ACD4NRV8_9HYPH|nr:hypothetical protein [Antarcticirhabdus aurantiaca]WAJ29539.1 hypothetical protein OXU80_04705 [Jeongeuplla avenae]
MQSILRAPHFTHPRGAACDTIDFARIPFDELEPGRCDPQAGRLLRVAFALNWRSHLGIMKDLVTAFSIEEFIALVKRADERRVWEYVDLPEKLLPYVLVLLADFTPDTAYRPNRIYGRFRPLTRWERFWVPERRQTLSDLWIRVPPIDYIVRGGFRLPNDPTALPPVDDYDVDTFVFDAHFLERPAPITVDFMVTRVRDELGFQ